MSEVDVARKIAEHIVDTVESVAMSSNQELSEAAITIQLSPTECIRVGPSNEEECYVRINVARDGKTIGLELDVDDCKALIEALRGQVTISREIQDDEAATKLPGQRYPEVGGFIDDQYSSRRGPSAAGRDLSDKPIAPLEMDI